MVIGAGAAVMIAGVSIPTATADPIADKRAQAQDLAAQIDSLGRKEGALADQYDGAVLQSQRTAIKVQQAQQALNAAQANAARVRHVLQSNAVNAYLHGGSLAAVASRNASGLNNGVLRGEYLTTISQNEWDALDAFHSAVMQEREARATLQSMQSLEQQAVARANADLNAARASERQLQATLDKVKGDLVTLVAQVQAAQQAAALRAAQAAVAAAAQQRQQAAAAMAAVQARQAAQAAAQSGPTTARLVAAPRPAATRSAPAPPRPAWGPPAPRPAPGPPPPVGGSGVGAAAVAAAESRVGDPYVFGGSGPSGFDCSGLTMWAYAQVGVSLPHYAPGQYAMSQHIPMSALQPGDLVFAGDLSHVAMYAGGGMIVEAEHTGVPVHVVPMWSFLVLAGRV
jgi:cell wall-associated NlpC family hydrolase